LTQYDAGFRLKTQADTKWTLELMKQKTSQLSAQGGTIGAEQGRVGTAVSVAAATIESFAAAESRISDADVAEESSRLLRLQILQQASVSALGQASSPCNCLPAKASVAPLTATLTDILLQTSSDRPGQIVDV
jgi:flagellin-like hook-associated protein FlgL